MEKIYKLLQSRGKEDILLGFHLLLRYSSEDILEFFRSHHFDTRIEGAYDIKVALDFKNNPIPNNTYIDLGNQWALVKTSGDFRLRDITSKGYVKIHKVISKENYLNGMY